MTVSALIAACPTCRAAAGYPCRMPRRDYETAPHKTRIDRAARQYRDAIKEDR